MKVKIQNIQNKKNLIQTDMKMEFLWCHMLPCNVNDVTWDQWCYKTLVMLHNVAWPKYYHDQSLEAGLYIESEHVKTIFQCYSKKQSKIPILPKWV